MTLCMVRGSITVHDKSRSALKENNVKEDCAVHP